jgi:hypothetical protein
MGEARMIGGVGGFIGTLGYPAAGETKAVLRALGSS